MRQLFKFDTVVFHNFDIRRFLRNPEFQRSFQKFLAGGKRIIVVGGEQVVGHRDYQELFLSGTSSQNCSWNSAITENGISGNGDCSLLRIFSASLPLQETSRKNLVSLRIFCSERLTVKGGWTGFWSPRVGLGNSNPPEKDQHLKPGRTGKGSGTGMRLFGRPCCSSQFGNGKGFSVIFLLAAPTMNRKRSKAGFICGHVHPVPYLGWCNNPIRKLVLRANSL